LKNGDGGNGGADCGDGSKDGGDGGRDIGVLLFNSKPLIFPSPSN